MARQLVYDKFIATLNEDQIKEITKLQHPKYILRRLMNQSGNEAVRTRSVIHHI
jgi:hypothetical protein